MRAMQERAYEKRGEQYLLIKSPPASGKSRALMFIALDKLNNQGVKQAVVNGRVKVGQRAAQNIATLGLARLPREGARMLWPVRANWVGFGWTVMPCLGGPCSGRGDSFRRSSQGCLRGGSADPEARWSGVLSQKFRSIRRRAGCW